MKLFLLHFPHSCLFVWFYKVTQGRRGQGKVLITLTVSLQLIRQALITSSGLGPAKCAHGNQGRVNPKCLCIRSSVRGEGEGIWVWFRGQGIAVSRFSL